MDMHENVKMAQLVFVLDWAISALLHRFGHVLVESAKMAQFKGKNQLSQFGIFMHIYDLSLSQPFWAILATPV